MLVTWLISFGLLIVISVQQQVPAEFLVLDAASVPGGRWYFGSITSLGIVSWTVASASCGVTGFVSRFAARPAAAMVFTRGAALIGLLMVDDLFLVHSWPFLPFPGKVLALLEAGLIVAWVLTGWRELRRTRWELLLASGGALAISTAIDLFDQPLYAGMWTVAEEGAKFLGIMALSVWSVHTSRAVLSSILLVVGSNSDVDDVGGVIKRDEVVTP